MECDERRPRVEVGDSVRYNFIDFPKDEAFVTLVEALPIRLLA